MYSVERDSSQCTWVLHDKRDVDYRYMAYYSTDLPF